MKRTPQVKGIRRALNLSQEEFAARFHIPLGTVRDWEQSRKAPEAGFVRNHPNLYLREVAGRHTG